MRAFVERELKLDLEEGFTLPELPGHPIEARLFTSTYYDTPDRSLGLAGITLRRRVENGLSCWQLKLPRDGNARAELEAAGGPAGPPDELAALLLAHTRHEQVAPVATLRTRRAGVRVADNGRTIADVTLDSVSVLDAGRAAGGFTELEVELVDGDDRDLESLGRALRRAGAKKSAGTPKLMRVLPPPPARPRVAKNAGAIELLQALLADQLRELLRHDPGVRVGADAEDVHRFRVATRRSRALIRATRPLLGDRLGSLAAELKWLAGLLGPVRDHDVLIAHLQAETDTLDVDQYAGEAIVAGLEETRERLREVLLAALESDRYLELLDSFELATAQLSDVRSKTKPRKLARKELRKLRRAARLPAVPSDAQLHKLRIAAKRARYAAELADEGKSTKRLRRYLAALKELQDIVGEHQDAVVAETALRIQMSPETALAAGRLIERERERRALLRRRYPKALRAALRRGRKSVG